MEAKHAPGPWRLSRTQRYVMDGVAAPWVCEVTERPGWEANARLIASAPALVEALKALVEEFGGTIEQYHKIGPDYTLSAGTEVFEVSTVLDREPLIEAARQALAQALGGE